MTHRAFQSHVLNRWILWIAALLMLFPAIQTTLYLHESAAAPAPQYRLVEGELQQYSRSRSSKSGRTTLFSMAGHPGRFWTQAMRYEYVESSWHVGRTRLRFYVQTNSQYSPMEGDAVKTFGLWVNGREVQSLEANKKEDQFQKSVLRVISFVMYAIAVGALVSGYRSSSDRSRTAA